MVRVVSSQRRSKEEEINGFASPGETKGWETNSEGSEEIKDFAKGLGLKTQRRSRASPHQVGARVGVRVGFQG